MRRSGFATKAEASAALTNVLQCERAGVGIDDTETVADYLHRWFEAKAADPQTEHRQPIPRLPGQRPHPRVRRDPPGTPHSRARRTVHPPRTRRRPQPGDPAPVCCHVVDRAQRRAARAPARPQRCPLRADPPPAPQGAHLLRLVFHLVQPRTPHRHRPAHPSRGPLRPRRRDNRCPATDPGHSLGPEPRTVHPPAPTEILQLADTAWINKPEPATSENEALSLAA